MNKWHCKNLALIVICLILCLISIPFNGYAAEFSDINKQESVSKMTENTEQMPENGPSENGTQNIGTLEGNPEELMPPIEDSEPPIDETEIDETEIDETEEIGPPIEKPEQPSEPEEPDNFGEDPGNKKNPVKKPSSETEIPKPPDTADPEEAVPPDDLSKEPNVPGKEPEEQPPANPDPSEPASPGPQDEKKYPVYSDGSFTFISKDNSTAMITNYHGTAINVTVPDTLSAEGRIFTVTAIGSFAFSEQDYDTIELPETVQKLEENAFYSSFHGHIYLPKSIVSIEGTLISTKYWCWKDSYAYNYLKSHGFSEEQGDIFCVDEPPKPSLYTENVSKTSITLAWEKIPYVKGYTIVSCDKNGRKQETIASITGNEKTSYRIQNLKSSKVYYYRICTRSIFQGKEYYGAYSPVLTVRTKPSKKSISSVNEKLKRGYFGKLTKKNISLPASVFTTYDSETWHYVASKDTGMLMKSRHGDWASVSEITNFWDHKGLANVVCSSSKTVYITRYETDFKKKSVVKIKKKYPLLGDAACDGKGNYYLIWGREDSAGTGNIATIAVSKYTYSGKHVKTVPYLTSSSNNNLNGWDTKIPFDAGNCSTVITDGILVCQYAREMYNGHQSSDVVAIDTEKMAKNYEYSTYTSHSFDQRVIALKDGGVCYADHGDAFPRGFHISFSKSSRYSEQTPFHFYGAIDANHTNAWLGGICETDTGIFLLGASGKSLRAGNQGKNLFIQLVDNQRKISGSKSRKGTCGEENCTDQGIKWLTNYSSGYDVANPYIIKTEDGRMVVLWEKFKKDTFVESYYMVLAGDGTTLQRVTPMQNTRLASFEEPLYKNGKIYWITAGKMKSSSKNGYSGYKLTEGTKAVVNCLEIGVLVKN